MLKILGRENSSNVQKVLWCCDELGVPFVREDYGGAFGKTKEPPYSEMNPNATVPTIIEDNFVLWESNTVVRYLAARYGTDQLYPGNVRDRASGEKWMDWQLSVLGPAISPVFWGLIRTRPEDRNDIQIDDARNKAAGAFAILDSYLDRTAYVARSNFTIYDIPVGIYTYRWFNLDIEREDLPNLRRWYDSLSQRSAYQKHVMLPLS